MLSLWAKAGPLPSDVRLYGGTALALYLGHRQSFDFDFVHVSGGITPEFVLREMEPFNRGDVRGGPGMVDVLWEGPHRNLKINYGECGPAFVPYPAREPLSAPNGVLVAHIEDVIAGKLRALANRDAARDYEDIARCVEMVPDAVNAAIDILDGQHDNIYRLAKAMSAPGPNATSQCSAGDLDKVAAFAVHMVDARQKTPRPGGGGPPRHG